MPKIRFYPHRVAAPDAVEWESWWVELHGERRALEGKLDGWDYAAEASVGVSVDVSSGAFIESTGLQDLAVVDLVAVADCKATQYRTTSRVSLPSAPRDPVDVRLTLPAGRFAEEIQLSAHLVLGRPRTVDKTRAAVWKGARLASSPVETLRLEGDAGRFPTEPVPFSTIFLGAAPWSVLCTYDELDEYFLGTVRLLVNTEDPAGKLALDPRGAKQVEALLRTDVVRQLIGEAARRLTDFPTDDFEEGSVGYVLSSISELFLGRSLKAAVQLYRDEPQQFELLLHERLRPTSAVLV